LKTHLFISVSRLGSTREDEVLNYFSGASPFREEECAADSRSGAGYVLPFSVGLSFSILVLILSGNDVFGTLYYFPFRKEDPQHGKS
jgi:hypothetical protein